MQQTSTTLVAISRYTLFRAKQVILSCEACDTAARTPFRDVLDYVRGVGRPTDYIMSEAATCPRCMGAVFETTRVDWERRNRSD